LTRAWHIGPRRFARSIRDGKGGLLAAGRWHHAGRPIIYTADSLSLAALEILAHVRSVDNIDDLVAHSFDIGDGISQETIDAARLPRHWNDPMPIEATRSIGDRWLRVSRSAVLWVPSAHAATQRNALLNPLHRDFPRIRVSKPTAFRFDPRIRTRLA